MDSVLINILLCTACGVVMVAVAFWQMLRAKEKPPMTNKEFDLNVCIFVTIFTVVVVGSAILGHILDVPPSPSEPSSSFRSAIPFFYWM